MFSLLRFIRPHLHIPLLRRPSFPASHRIFCSLYLLFFFPLFFSLLHPAQAMTNPSPTTTRLFKKKQQPNKAHRQDAEVSAASLCLSSQPCWCTPFLSCSRADTSGYRPFLLFTMLFMVKSRCSLGEKLSELLHSHPQTPCWAATLFTIHTCTAFLLCLFPLLGFYLLG